MRWLNDWRASWQRVRCRRTLRVFRSDIFHTHGRIGRRVWYIPLAEKRGISLEANDEVRGGGRGNEWDLAFFVTRHPRLELSIDVLWSLLLDGWG